MANANRLSSGDVQEQGLNTFIDNRPQVARQRQLQQAIQNTYSWNSPDSLQLKAGHHPILTAVNTGVIQRRPDNYSVAEARHILELTEKLQIKVDALNILRFKNAEPKSKEVQDEIEDIQDHDSLGRFQSVILKDQLSAIRRSIEAHAPANGKAKPEEKKTSQHVSNILDRAEIILVRFEKNLAILEKQAANPLPRKPDLGRAVTENVLVGTESTHRHTQVSAAGDIQEHHQVGIAGGPWSEESTQVLEAVKETWDNLPDEHVKDNPYIGNLKYMPEGRPGVPDTVSGEHLDTSMLIYPGAIQEGDVGGTVAHETGHGVHINNPELLENLKAAAGWEHHTVESARKLMLKDKLSKGSASRALKTLRDADNDRWGVVARGNYVYRRAPGTKDFLWVRRFGTLPGDEDINSRRNQRNEWIKTADEGEHNPHEHEWDYGRTQPIENFAEMYRMMYQNPKKVYKEFVVEPKSKWQSAEVSKKGKLKIIMDSRLKQWKLFRNEVFKSAEAADTAKGRFADDIDTLRGQEADANELGTWNDEIQSLDQLATPKQVKDKIEELEFSKPQTKAEKEEAAKQAEVRKVQQTSDHGDIGEDEWEDDE